MNDKKTSIGIWVFAVLFVAVFTAGFFAGTFTQRALSEDAYSKLEARYTNLQKEHTRLGNIISKQSEIVVGLEGTVDDLNGIINQKDSVIDRYYRETQAELERGRELLATTRKQLEQAERRVGELQELLGFANDNRDD